MSASEARRLKELESDNTRLKLMLVDAMLDNTAPKEVLSKKW